MKKMKTVWLKKYTKLEYLPAILTDRRLHLGNPKDWPDKNDSGLIELYSNTFDVTNILVTCLTEAADRFHFWDIFGEREKGVCLWFDRSALLKDIRNDQSLVGKKARYLSHDGLRRLDASSIPFAKRAQYRDEREFRVLRKSPALHTAADKFEFSALSLKRIYLNSWLSPDESKQWGIDINSLLANELVHVEVRQNRILNDEAWIEAAKAALKMPN